MGFLVAGMDEVGRGAFAGPLVVVAAMFQVDEDWREDLPCPIPGVKDSKAYSSKDKRALVAQAIRDHAVLAGVGIAGIKPSEINLHGMGWAMKQGFLRAASALDPAPDLLLVDGDRPCSGWNGAQMCKPKADALWWPVSAASVLAKVMRDQLMAELHQTHPEYGWATNSGYGTGAHMDALRKHGVTEHHRTAFVETALKRTAQHWWKEDA